MFACSSPKPESFYPRRLKESDPGEDERDSLRRSGSGLDKYRPPRPWFLTSVNETTTCKGLRCVYRSFSTVLLAYHPRRKLSKVGWDGKTPSSRHDRDPLEQISLPRRCFQTCLPGLSLRETSDLQKSSTLELSVFSSGRKCPRLAPIDLAMRKRSNHPLGEIEHTWCSGYDPSWYRLRKISMRQPGSARNPILTQGSILPVPYPDGLVIRTR